MDCIKPNFNRCPICKSYNYTIGYFTTAHNCKCSDCGALWWYSFPKHQDMVKTIEEAAREFAAKLNYSMEAKHNMHPRDFEIAFESGANYLLSLPLQARLTEAERDRVREIYAEAQIWLDEDIALENRNNTLRVMAVGIQDRLERIFGKEMFNESKEEDI